MATGNMKMTSNSQPRAEYVMTQSSPPIDLLQIRIGVASDNVNLTESAMDTWIHGVPVSGLTLICAD
jgi:hypothetical protein